MPDLDQAILTPFVTHEVASRNLVLVSLCPFHACLPVRMPCLPALSLPALSLPARLPALSPTALSLPARLPCLADLPLPALSLAALSLLACQPV